MLPTNEDRKLANKLGLSFQEIAQIKRDEEAKFGTDGRMNIGARTHESALSHRVAAVDIDVFPQRRLSFMGE